MSIEREDIAAVLKSIAAHAAARRKLSEEIYHAFLAHPKLQSNKFKHLYSEWRQALRRYNRVGHYRSDLEGAFRNAQKNMMDYCQQEGVVRAYIQAYQDYKVLLGYQGALLYAEIVLKPKNTGPGTSSLSFSMGSAAKTTLALISIFPVAIAQPHFPKLNNSVNDSSNEHPSETEVKTYVLPSTADKEAKTSDKKSADTPWVEDADEYAQKIITVQTGVQLVPQPLSAEENERMIADMQNYGNMDRTQKTHFAIYWAARGHMLSSLALVRAHLDSSKQKELSVPYDIERGLVLFKQAIEQATTVQEITALEKEFENIQLYKFKSIRPADGSLMPEKIDGLHELLKMRKAHLKLDAKKPVEQTQKSASFSAMQKSLNAYKVALLYSSWSWSSIPNERMSREDLSQRGAQLNESSENILPITVSEKDVGKVQRAARSGNALASRMLALSHTNAARKEARNKNEQHWQLKLAEFFFVQACQQDERVGEDSSGSHRGALEFFSSELYRNSNLAGSEENRQLRMTFHALAIKAKLSIEEYLQLPKKEKEILDEVLKNSAEGTFESSGLSLRTDLSPTRFAEEKYLKEAVILMSMQEDLVTYFNKNPSALKKIKKAAGHRNIQALKVLSTWAFQLKQAVMSELYLLEQLEFEPGAEDSQFAFLQLACAAAEHITSVSSDVPAKKQLIDALEKVNQHYQTFLSPEVKELSTRATREIARVRALLAPASASSSSRETKASETRLVKFLSQIPQKITMFNMIAAIMAVVASFWVLRRIFGFGRPQPVPRAAAGARRAVEAAQQREEEREAKKAAGTQSKSQKTQTPAHPPQQLTQRKKEDKRPAAEQLGKGMWAKEEEERDDSEIKSNRKNNDKNNQGLELRPS